MVEWPIAWKSVSNKELHDLNWIACKVKIFFYKLEKKLKAPQSQDIYRMNKNKREERKKKQQQWTGKMKTELTLSAYHEKLKKPLCIQIVYVTKINGANTNQEKKREKKKHAHTTKHEVNAMRLQWIEFHFLIVPLERLL